MARIRTIKPEFCTSTSTARLSRDARLFFLLLLTEADDRGRLVNSPKRLAGCLYPHDDDVTVVKIGRWLKEVVGEDMVRAYEVDGGRYLAVVTFTKHQRISHPTPSRLPRPPWEPPDKDPQNSGDAPAETLVGSRKLEVGSRKGSSAGPDTPEAVRRNPGALAYTTTALAELKTVDLAKADACGKCDQGWLNHDDGSVSKCPCQNGRRS
jgi:hypothetical protein